MITIKTSMYSENELKKLAECFDYLETFFMISNCRRDTCKNCNVKHLCYDITMAKDYTKKVKIKKK